MMIGKIKLIAVLALVLLAGTWIFQNREIVQTKLLFFTVTMPQSALLAITLLAGVAIGILLAWTLSGKRIAKGR